MPFFNPTRHDGWLQLIRVPEAVERARQKTHGEAIFSAVWISEADEFREGLRGLDVHVRQDLCRHTSKNRRYQLRVESLHQFKSTKGKSFDKESRRLATNTNE